MSTSVSRAIWSRGTARTLPPTADAALSACAEFLAVMVTSWPAAARRFANAEPMLPAPMIPILLRAMVSLLSRCDSTSRLT